MRHPGEARQRGLTGSCSALLSLSLSQLLVIEPLNLLNKMNIMKIETRRVRDERAIHIYKHTAEMVRKAISPHNVSV